MAFASIATIALVLLYIVKAYSFLQNSTSDLVKCKKEYLRSQKGTISSPGFPVSYPNHTSCTWYILGKPDEVITVSFDHVDIEEDILCDNPPCCNYNWLKIGPTSNSRGRRYCGQNYLNPSPFLSIGSRVWIKFHISNIAKGGRGFQLSYIISSRQAKYCGKDEFHCSDSKCILSRWTCNHYNECRDGSDEMFCKDGCPQNFLPCHSGIHGCYSADKHCDGIQDCSDSSDEAYCTYCGENKIRCGVHSLECYDLLKERCNRIFDCKNGEDEKGCLGCKDKIPCSSGQGCYSWEERCNGIPQCEDYSDERNCGLKNSVISAAVMGSLICGLLLMIAISCTCRLFSLRSVEQQMTNQETPLSRFAPDSVYPEPPPSYASSVGRYRPGSYLENYLEVPQVYTPRRNGRSGRRGHQRTSQPIAQQAEREAVSGVMGPLSSNGSRNTNRENAKNYCEQPNSENLAGTADDSNANSPDLDSPMRDRRPLINETF